jgi:hypothetical protein
MTEAEFALRLARLAARLSSEPGYTRAMAARDLAELAETMRAGEG